MTRQQTISPIDGSIYAEYELASEQAVEAALQRALDEGWSMVRPERRVPR